MCREFFTNPSLVIAKAKKQKDINHTLKILMIEWLFFGVGFFIVSSILFRATSWLLVGISVFLSVFISGVIATIFIGWIIELIITTLGGKGKYFEGLTACVFGLFPISIGLLISSIVSFIPMIGFLISLILITLSSAVGISMFYRGLKEMFGTDMITTWIGVGILIVSTFLAFYLSLALMMFTVSGYTGFIPTVFQNAGCPFAK
jgi:hypothetical protein